MPIEEVLQLVLETNANLQSLATELARAGYRPSIDATAVRAAWDNEGPDQVHGVVRRCQAINHLLRESGVPGQLIAHTKGDLVPTCAEVSALYAEGCGAQVWMYQSFDTPGRWAIAYLDGDNDFAIDGAASDAAGQYNIPDPVPWIVWAFNGGEPPLPIVAWRSADEEQRRRSTALDAARNPNT